MAGEWLKFDSTLPEKPETLAIAGAMGWTDPDLVVGKLMRLFRWFDQQTTDGNAAGVTPALLDHIIGVAGFVQAVANVGWLTIHAGGLTLAKFDRHNGASAKSRAQTAKRVANLRGNAKANADGNAPTVTPPLAREEKRREEEKNSEAIASAAVAAAIDARPDAIFALGLPLLVTSGVPEGQARKFLGFLRKHNTDDAVARAIDRCASTRALEPITFLQGCLKTGARHVNRQEAIEADGKRVADAWAKESA